MDGVPLHAWNIILFFKLLDSTKGQFSKVDSITGNKYTLDYARILNLYLMFGCY